jgi:acyl-CoA oxidase
MMHHLSAGFKAIYSRIAYDGIDSCRQACGGAGFSAHSGLPSLQADYAPNTTYEGDNTVMLQQAARLLAKTWKKSQKGELAKGWLSYLNNVEALLKEKAQIASVEQALCLDRLDKALAVRAAYKYRRTMELLKELEGKSENEKTHSLAAVDLVSMAQSHILYLAFQIYRKQIASVKCPNLKGHLEDLGRLYALTELQQDSAACYESGFLSMGSGAVLLNAQKQLLTKLRPQMIPLLEAWAFPDNMLVSAIGNSYGDIYETQLEWARNSRLNKSPVPKGFKEYMQPILTGKL